MTDQPENHTISLLRTMREEVRRDVAAAMETVNTAMRATVRVYERLESFQAELTQLAQEIALLRGDVSAGRQETRKGLLQLESAVTTLDMQNMSRHGETINLLRDATGLKQEFEEVRRQIGNGRVDVDADGTIYINGNRLIIDGKPLAFSSGPSVPLMP